MYDYWRKSNEWGGAAMNTEAESNSSGAETLQGHYEAYAGAKPPAWVGDAQRVAWADRDLVLERVQKQCEVLDEHGTLNRDTAVALGGLLRTKVELIRHAGASGVEVHDSGAAYAKWDFHPPPTDYQVMDVVSAVLALDDSFRQFDQDVAERLTVIASTLNDADRNLDAVDRMNRLLAAQLDGALEGASWDLEGEYEAILEQIRAPFWFGLDEGALQFAIQEVGDVPEWLRDFLYDGDFPTMNEVAAFHAYNILLSGDEQKWDALKDSFLGPILPDLPFAIDEELGEDGSPFPAELKNTFQSEEPMGDLHDLMAEMEAVYSRDNYDTGRGVVQVHVIEQGDGQPPKFIAVIPGTSIALDDDRGWHGDPEGTDWPANVLAMGYGNSSVVQSAMSAIDAAVAQWEQDNGQSLDRADVTIAGHSQGGLIAATIAEDRAFTSRHNVEHVFTAGSPIGHTNPAGDTDGINLSNETDFVPALDGHHPIDVDPLGVGAGPGNRHTDAYEEFLLEDSQYGGPAPNEDSIEFGHSQGTYVDRVEEALAADSATATDTERALQEFNEAMAPYWTDAETHTVYEYTFGRE